MPRRYPLAHMFCTRTNQPTSAEMTWGPNAHELLMASLGACANMTVQMYAERHQYPLKGLQAGVSCTRVLAENPPGSDAKGRNGGPIEMDISFAGELSEE